MHSRASPSTNFILGQKFPFTTSGGGGLPLHRTGHSRTTATVFQSAVRQLKNKYSRKVSMSSEK